MNKIMLMLMVFTIISISFVSAVDVPEDKNSIILQKIDLEHKQTRNHIQSELAKREKSFIEDFTKRADYYESSYKDLTNTAVLKLGSFFAGIMILISSVQYLMNNRLKKREYAVLKDALKKDIVNEFKTENFELPKNVNLFANEQKQQMQDSDFKKKFFKKKHDEPKQKKSFFGRRN